MGRSITPKYRLEMFRRNLQGQVISDVQCWKGRASDKALEAKVLGIEESYKIGGVNEHISRSLGYLPAYNRARIVDQKSGATVAEWISAPFRAI